MSKDTDRIVMCKLCNFPFKASRSDATYCTWGCRQRAKRVRDGTLTQAQAEKLARDARAAFSAACVQAHTDRINRGLKKARW